MWDVDNNKFIDMCNGYGALLLGHARHEIINAVATQLTSGTLYCVPTKQEVLLANMLTKNFPSMDKIRLVNTGGEATMTAIRLARGHTKRNMIVKFEGCYHGAHDSVLVKAGSGAAHTGVPVSDGIPPQVSRGTLIAKYNDYADIEQIIENNSDDIAGVIIEPVLANMGLIPPAKQFLQKIRKLTKKYDIQLIFDEVVTGFRMAPGGAQQKFGIKPDITTLAKAMSNGFTIAAVGGKEEIMDKLAPGGTIYQASTFAGNPIAVSAAIASIETMNTIGDKLYTKLDDMCIKLSNAVSDIATDYGIPHQIHRVASMMQIFFSKDPVVDYTSSLAADSTKFKKMFETILKHGVFIAPSQFEVVFLSYALNIKDLDDVIEAYRAGLGAVRTSNHG